MSKSQVESTALAAVALAATLGLTLLSGPFAWMGSILGLLLLLVLFGFDQEGYRTVLGSLAFSAVCGFCFALACGAVFELLAAHGEVHLANGGWQTVGLPFTWLFATAVLWAIDRSRMGNRLPAADGLVSRPGVGQRSFIRDPEPAVPVASPARSYAPDVRATSFAPSIAVEPQATYSQQPVAQQPVYAEQPPVHEPSPFLTTRPPSFVTPATSQPAGPSAAPVTPAPIMPAPIISAPIMPPPVIPAPPIPRTGKEVMIYVNLIGEGLNVMRSVMAEHLGRDYYKIIDTMPAGENWQFQPGQVVRCKKQTLSTGKALVAIEEAPRAQ